MQFCAKRRCIRMQTDRKPLQENLCYTTIQNQQWPKAKVLFSLCVSVRDWQQTSPIVTDIQASNRRQHIISTSNHQVTKNMNLLYTRCFWKGYVGISLLFIACLWVCLSGAGETEGVMLLCAVRSSVCLQLVEMMCTCAWVCVLCVSTIDMSEQWTPNRQTYCDLCAQPFVKVTWKTQEGYKWG